MMRMGMRTMMGHRMLAIEMVDNLGGTRRIALKTLIKFRPLTFLSRN